MLLKMACDHGSGGSVNGSRAALCCTSLPGPSSFLTQVAIRGATKCALLELDSYGNSEIEERGLERLPTQLPADDDAQRGVRTDI